MKIGDHIIEGGCRTAIIAELGTLHLHKNSKHLEDVVQDCINAGADFVKIQMINWRTAWWSNEIQLKRYKEIEWSIEKWNAFFNLSQHFSKPVFPSVFDEWYLSTGLVDMYPAIKVANKVVSMPYLSNRILASGKPVIVSLSMSDRVKPWRVPNVKIQFVQTQYPTEDKDLILPCFGEVYHGLSIHSENLRAMAASIMMGAQTLEVHVQGKDASGPDTKFALTLKQLERLVKIRDKITSPI